MSERALVIVPTYNERENVERLVATVLVMSLHVWAFVPSETVVVALLEGSPPRGEMSFQCWTSNPGKNCAAFQRLAGSVESFTWPTK